MPFPSVLWFVNDLERKPRSKKKKKQKDVLCQEGIILLWHEQVPFCYSLMLQKFIFLPNHSIRVCAKGKRINLGVGNGLEIPAEYIFYGNEKAIQ